MQRRHEHMEIILVCNSRFKRWDDIVNERMKSDVGGLQDDTQTNYLEML